MLGLEVGHACAVLLDVELVEEGAYDFAICVLKLVLFFERHMTGFLPLLAQLLYFCYGLFARCGVFIRRYDIQAADDFAFGSQIGLLGSACVAVDLFLRSKNVSHALINRRQIASLCLRATGPIVFHSF